MYNLTLQFQIYFLFCEGSIITIKNSLNKISVCLDINTIRQCIYNTPSNNITMILLVYILI